jgi:hypothetical protein
MGTLHSPKKNESRKNAHYDSPYQPHAYTNQYSLGGIAEVSTKNQYRGRGLAATLLEVPSPLLYDLVSCFMRHFLQMCMEYMEKNSFEISFLHSSAAAPYYAKLGWASCPLYQIHKNVTMFPRCVPCVLHVNERICFGLVVIRRY